MEIGESERPVDLERVKTGQAATDETMSQSILTGFAYHPFRFRTRGLRAWTLHWERLGWGW